MNLFLKSVGILLILRSSDAGQLRLQGLRPARHMPSCLHVLSPARKQNFLSSRMYVDWIPPVWVSSRRIAAEGSMQLGLEGSQGGSLWPICAKCMQRGSLWVSSGAGMWGETPYIDSCHWQEVLGDRTGATDLNCSTLTPWLLSPAPEVTGESSRDP